MQLNHLRYFVAVAELGHFTRAADRVGVAQPTLSRQIHALEAHLGAALFTRGPAGATLTQAGEALLPLARRMVADAETARRAVGEVVGVRRGRVRLGATPSLCASLVPAVLRECRQSHPGVELRVTENGSRDLVADLAGGELDLALIILPDEGVDPALRTRPLLRETLVVASSRAAAPLAPAGRALPMAALRHHELVMFRPGYDLREATLAACRRAGFAPRYAVEGGEMDAVLAFVEAGLGVALLPGTAMAGRPGLRATPLAGPPVRRTVALAERRESVLPHAARALRGILLEQLGRAHAAGLLPAGVAHVPPPPDDGPGTARAPQPNSPGDPA